MEIGIKFLALPFHVIGIEFGGLGQSLEKIDLLAGHLSFGLQQKVLREASGPPVHSPRASASDFQ